jgi:hypothetical protein
MTAVEDLVAREASGVLEINGSPSGAIYLDGGRIAFARASWVPGLAARLHAACPQLAGAGTPPGGRDDADMAALAVQRGYLTPRGLHELIESVVVDAFLVLTIPVAVDSFVAAIRFTSTRTYWTEIFPRFALEPVRAEAVRRAERMAEHGLAPTTQVALRDLRAPAAVITREQWQLACQIGEHASARDLAARRGAALSDTLNCLGLLTQAGLCAPVRVARRGQPDRSAQRPPGRIAAAPRFVPAGEPHSAPQSERHSAPQSERHSEPQSERHSEPRGAERLPARGHVQDQAAREHLARAAAHAAGQSAPVAVDILRQVLAGLRNLS